MSIWLYRGEISLVGKIVYANKAVEIEITSVFSICSSAPIS